MRNNVYHNAIQKYYKMIYRKVALEMTKRDVSILVRLTENEKATLERKAEIADESLSSFVRKIALGYKIIPPKEIGIVQGNQLDMFSGKRDELESLQRRNDEQEKIIQAYLSCMNEDGTFFDLNKAKDITRQVKAGRE